MATECRRLAATCNTTEAEQVLSTAADDLDHSAEQKDLLSAGIMNSADPHRTDR
jgi:hypothetical protein